MLAAIPAGTQGNTASHSVPNAPAIIRYSQDPNGTSNAFNYTLAHFDLYTNKTVSMSAIPPGGNLTWFSSLNNTLNGAPINGTAFIYKGPSSSVSQTINWTLNIPRGAGIITFLKFDWNGTLGTGTSATYMLYNGTTATSPVVLRVVRNANFTGGPPLNATGAVPLNCSTNDECFDVTKFWGFKMTLKFLFNSTATAGLKVQVSNVEVASVGLVPNHAFSHYMFKNPGNSTEIIHYGEVSLTYNSTVTYPKPNVSGQNLVHTWNNTLVNLFTPTSYKVDSITFNGTALSIFAPHFFSQGPCIPKGVLLCTNAVFKSLNITSPKAKNMIALFTVRTINAVTSLTLLNEGVTTDFWTPGENITAKIVNQPGVNATGPQNIWFTSPTGTSPVNNVTATLIAKRGAANFTVTLPFSPSGNWSITSTFLNGWDYGILSHKFRIEEIGLNSGFTLSGGAGNGTALSLQGTLSYASNSSAASNVNATVFAIDEGSRAGLMQTRGTPASGLYISNITLVAGFFSVGQSFTMYFSLINPAQQQFSANVTIEHEWNTGQTHGVSATFPLTFGDEPFLSTTPLVYRVIGTITRLGIQLQVQSLQTNNKISVNMSSGVSPVPLLRQHFGLFKMTIRSKNLISSTITSQSVESPLYAYVLYSPLIPSRYLAFSATVTTQSGGSFSTSIISDQLLAAKNLVLIVLARDTNGIALGDSSRNPSAASDSTILTPTADVPTEIVVKQSASVTLHLKNNSTRIPITLTVNLDVTGATSIPTVKQTTTIAAGKMGDVPFNFVAPSTPGTYLLTFSSSQYGAPFLTKTLQVSLVPSNLQTLVPVAIGLGFALIVLAIYMLKRQPSESEPEEKPKPATGKPKPQTGQPSSKSLTRT